MTDHDYQIEKMYHPENFENFECECREGVSCDNCTDEDCECPGHPSQDIDSYPEE